MNVVVVFGVFFVVIFMICVCVSVFLCVFFIKFGCGGGVFDFGVLF